MAKKFETEASDEDAGMSIEKPMTVIQYNVSTRYKMYIPIARGKRGDSDQKSILQSGSLYFVWAGVDCNGPRGNK